MWENEACQNQLVQRLRLCFLIFSISISTLFLALSNALIMILAMIYRQYPVDKFVLIFQANLSPLFLNDSVMWVFLSVGTKTTFSSLSEHKFKFAIDFVYCSG